MLVQSGVAAEGIALLEKPFTGARLAATVHAVLDGNGPAARAPVDP